MTQSTDESIIGTLQEEIEIAKYQRAEGIEGSKLGELFDYYIKKCCHDRSLLCTYIYNLGKVHGVRQERAKKRSFIDEFEKLSPQNKEFVKTVAKTLVKETGSEGKKQHYQEQQRRNKERVEIKKRESEIKSKCDSMTADDFRKELNEIFSCMEQYKLRYFYIFITEKIRR